MCLDLVIGVAVKNIVIGLGLEMIVGMLIEKFNNK